MEKPKTVRRKLEDFWNSEVVDEEKWAQNSKVLRSLGLFAASIVLMRSFGDLMAI